jgi:cytochrome c553
MLRAAALFCVITLSAPALAAGPAGNAEAGAREAEEHKCASCHGATGNESIDNAHPVLAGQYADYLVKALQDYRSGKRKNPIMVGQAQSLTDAEIDDLAAFFASQDGAIHDLSDSDAR